MTRPGVRRRHQRLAVVLSCPRWPCSPRLRVPAEREPGCAGPGRRLQRARRRRRRPPARRATRAPATPRPPWRRPPHRAAPRARRARRARPVTWPPGPALPAPPEAPQPQRPAPRPPPRAGPTATSPRPAATAGPPPPGVTATTITVGNIASISGVAPGLTQSAQQATEAWAAYVNSTGGICGRQIKVQPFDDGNDSGTNYADAQQACSADFAMVGNASGFDDGSAQAVERLRHPDHGRRGLDGGGRQHGRHLRGQSRQRPLLGARPGQLPQDDLPERGARRRP